MNELIRHLIIILPSLILANVVHMIIVKKNILSFLNRPISTSQFGSNKTWRGMLLVPFLNVLFLYFFNSIFKLQISNVFFMGLILGFAYVIFELPNSFMKRRLNISEGQSANQNKYLFMLIDKMDSAFGVSLVYYLITGISPFLAFLVFICSSLTHILMSLFLVAIKVKSAF